MTAPGCNFTSSNRYWNLNRKPVENALQYIMPVLESALELGLVGAMNLDVERCQGTAKDMGEFFDLLLVQLECSHGRILFRRNRVHRPCREPSAAYANIVP